MPLLQNKPDTSQEFGTKLISRNKRNFFEKVEICVFLEFWHKMKTNLFRKYETNNCILSSGTNNKAQNPGKQC